MKIDRRIGIILWGFFLGLFSAFTATGNGGLFDLSWKEFRESREVHQAIDPKTLQYDLLAAAVLHETNRRREDHHLQPLRHLKQVRVATEIHARAMAEHGIVAHVNPHDADVETLRDRMARVGLHPTFAAENIALTSAMKYQDGNPLYPRQEAGETVFSYQPGGPPIPRHSYLSFAEALVEQWMNSPGHRKNILHREPRFLGAGHHLARNSEGLDMVYAVQVFFTPVPGSLDEDSLSFSPAEAIILPLGGGDHPPSALKLGFRGSGMRSPLSPDGQGNYRDELPSANFEKGAQEMTMGRIQQPGISSHSFLQRKNLVDIPDASTTLAFLAISALALELFRRKIKRKP